MREDWSEGAEEHGELREERVKEEGPNGKKVRRMSRGTGHWISPGCCF